MIKEIILSYLFIVSQLEMCCNGNYCFQGGGSAGKNNNARIKNILKKINVAMQKFNEWSRRRLWADVSINSISLKRGCVRLIVHYY